jgi:Leucine-rich repeat (LRR) protein
MERNIDENWDMFTTELRLLTGKTFNHLKRHFTDHGVLSLSGMQMRSIPSSISELKNLKSLLLADNNLKCLPDEIYSLKSLQELNLGNNKLKKINQKISELENLQLLHLSSNIIKQLPSEISELRNLEYLWLNNNPIQSLQKEIFLLPKLKILNLANTNINDIDQTLIIESPSLHTLFLPKVIKSIPTDLFNLKRRFNYILSVETDQKVIDEFKENKSENVIYSYSVF